jgi:hypothetical protein
MEQDAVPPAAPSDADGGGPGPRPAEDPSGRAASDVGASSVPVPRGAESRTWDEQSVFQRIEEQLGDDQCRAARALYEWGRAHVAKIRWGSGARESSFILEETTPGGQCPFLAVYTSGHVELRFSALSNHPPFHEEVARRELTGRLVALPGVDLPDDAHNRRPSMNLAAFVEPTTRSGLIKVLDGIVVGLRNAGGPQGGKPVAQPEPPADPSP